jgi:hypothetical protein
MAFGLVIGLLIGEGLVVIFSRWWRRAPQVDQSSESRYVRPTLYLVLPIALPIAVLFDYWVTRGNAQDFAAGALGMVIGVPLGHRAFHRLRQVYRRVPSEGSSPSPDLDSLSHDLEKASQK